MMKQTPKSKQNQEWEDKRRKNTPYRMSPKGRFLTQREMAELRNTDDRWVENYANFIDYRRTIN